MNSLSWLIYLADAIPQVGVLLTIATMVLGIGGLISLIVFAASEGELETLPLTFRLLAGCSVVAFLSVATPSRQTILLIAASEMGETVVKSP